MADPGLGPTAVAAGAAQGHHPSVAFATASVSIIIPAYNEANRLPPTLRSVLSYAGNQVGELEVIVVDDGSIDDTAELAQAVADEDFRVKVLRLPANRGTGGAIRAGVAVARGDFILFSDADGSIPIQELERLWPALDRGADLVVASRHVTNRDVAVHSIASRNAFGLLFQWFVRLVAAPGVHDTQCGFKLFRGAVARDLFGSTYSERFAFDVEILMLAKLRGYAVVEVAVNCRHVAGSKVELFRDGLIMGLDVIRMRLSLGRRHARSSRQR